MPPQVATGPETFADRTGPLSKTATAEMPRRGWRHYHQDARTWTRRQARNLWRRSRVGVDCRYGLKSGATCMLRCRCLMPPTGGRTSTLVVFLSTTSASFTVSLTHCEVDVDADGTLTSNRHWPRSGSMYCFHEKIPVHGGLEQASRCRWPKRDDDDGRNSRGCVVER